MIRTNRFPIRKVRYAVQWTIFFIVLFAGYRFYLFTDQLSRGDAVTITRPPSVEGFLPIGALMSLKLLVTEGLLDPVHPAAVVIFSGALLSSTLLKKSFCGWICPVGTLSDGLWKIGEEIFGRNFKLPVAVDYALRSIKYVVMAFFLYIILVKMSTPAIIGFLNTPYWKVTDIKMLRFFTDMSQATMITLLALFALSLFYKNFWCRYLCPYGGLVGLLSMLSPAKIRRDERACIHCGLCSKNCPSLLPVERKETIRSPECTGCLTCVSHCLAAGALDPALTTGRRVGPLAFILAVMTVFFGPILLAMATGRWHSSLSHEELRALIPLIDALVHP